MAAVTRDTEGLLPDRSLARWPAILSGAVIAFLTLVVFSSLWTAWGSQNPNGFIADNVEWFELATAVFAAFVGSYVAGWLQAVRGVVTGMVTGLTVWGLMLFASIALGVPTIISAFEGGIQGAIEGTTTGFDISEWATFIAFGGGALTALLGGALGGMTPRPGLGERFEFRERREAVEPAEPVRRAG